MTPPPPLPPPLPLPRPRLRPRPRSAALALAHALALALALAVAPAAPCLAQQPAPPAETDDAQPHDQGQEQDHDQDQTQPPPPAPANDARSRVANLDQRLAALDGSAPGAYLELAEEVSYETGTPEDRRLARQLYALAYAIARRNRADPALAAGACLGLAAIEPSDEGAAWLRAVAGLIDPNSARIARSTIAAPTIPGDVALDAATALGLARAGHGRRAARLYEQPRVAAVFERYGDLLGGRGGLSGLARFERALRDWPDHECGGTRTVTRRGPDGIEVSLCPVDHGNPGPPLTRQEFLAHLRFESRLLDGIHQSWGAQVTADGGAPLLDPDPDQVLELLQARYGLPTTSPLYRDGRWTGTLDQPQPVDSSSPDSRADPAQPAQTPGASAPNG